MQFLLHCSINYAQKYGHVRSIAVDSKSMQILRISIESLRVMDTKQIYFPHDVISSRRVKFKRVSPSKRSTGNDYANLVIFEQALIELPHQALEAGSLLKISLFSETN